jgi:glutamine amidotransferase
LKVGVVQYGNGNVHAVMRALTRCSVDPIIVDKPEKISNCDKLIFPGVGHFKNAMDALVSGNWISALEKFAIEDKKPFLGICLGMQLLSEFSEEGDISGLGWIHGKVIKMQKGDSTIKIPHMGWNQLLKRNGTILQDVTGNDFFYFTHSYHWADVAAEEILCTTIYGTEIITGVKKENIWGVQFHPEKSYESGKKVIQLFLQIP